MFKYKCRRDRYYSKDSCKFLMQYHLIFVCKYRKKLFTGSFADDIKNIMTGISRKYDFEIKTIESDKDHIHLLVSSTPQISVSQIVRVLKQESTLRAWKLHYDILRKQFWKENTFWTDGYFVATIGDVSQKTLQKIYRGAGKRLAAIHISH